MSKPDWNTGVELDKKWAKLKGKLKDKEAELLNANFKLVNSIAGGNIYYDVVGTELRLIASNIPISAAPAVPSKSCFDQSGVFTQVDKRICELLPGTVPAVGPGNASTFELTKNLGFNDIAAKHLGISGSCDKLAKALIKRGKTWSPFQIDCLLRRYKNGDDVLGLRSDVNLGNFWPVHVGDTVYWIGDLMYKDFCRVAIHDFRWDPIWLMRNRVVFRN